MRQAVTGTLNITEATTGTLNVTQSVTGTLYAFDYYVDSVNGDDNNSGDTPAQAWASIASLDNADVTTGTRIGLAKGSTWREQLTIGANNVTVAAYGTGDAPLLDCSDLLTNASFSKTAGRTNVYQIATSVAAGSVNHYINLWEDDAHLARADDVADCDATPGSYYPSSDYGSITLYVHASDSSDITANGSVYEVSARRYGLAAFQRTGLTLRGISARRNLHNDGSIQVGRSCNLYDCTALDGGKHNLYVEDGCYLSGCIAQNAANNRGTLFIVYDTNPGGLGVTFDDCQAIYDSYGDGGGGFYDHHGGSGDYGTVLYRNCTATNCSNGFTSLSAVTMRLEDCTVSGGRVCVLAERPLEVSGGTFSVVNTGTQACFEIGTSGSTLSIDGATFGAVPSVNTILVQSVNAGRTITITNCTIPANAYPIFLTGASSTVTFTGNTVGNTTNCLNLSGSPTLTADNNTYGTGGFRLDSVSYTFAEWQALGYDANSTHGGA